MVPRILRPNPLSLALTLALVAPAGLKHDFHRAVFVYTLHPDVPVTRFIAGEIGIPEPKHARIYLFAAYRYLEGKPLTQAEQKQWLNVWTARTSNSWPEWKADQAWLRARKRIPVPAPPESVRPAESLQRNFVYGGPCTDDAFTTAARTLEARARRFGPNSAEVKFWVQGQDAVFNACATAAPQNLPPAQNPLLRADRDYQIAAATLYARDYDEAAALFQKIAQDPQSPWRTWAPYQKGRALLYKARQTQSDKIYNAAILAAQNQFQSVLANPALRQSHQAAEYLFLRCLLVTDQRTALERLARRLLRGDWQETDLTLYLNGLDNTPSPPRDPLTQWIRAFQKQSPVPVPQSPAWLYAALRTASANVPDVWLESARASSQPSLRYAAALHLARNGRTDAAREILVTVLDDLKTLPSARNRALQLHAQLAATWEEFLARSPRAAILASAEMDGDEWRSRAQVDPEILTTYSQAKFAKYRQEYLRDLEQTKSLQAQLHWDEPSVRILSERIPLDLLASAIDHPSLPPNLKEDLALQVFTRAAILNRWLVAKQAATHLQSASRQAFLQNPNEATAAILLLDFPDAKPFATSGFGRAMPATEFDSYARNWWNVVTVPGALRHALPYLSDERGPLPEINSPLPFLSDHQIREAAQEWQILQKTGPGLEWIAAAIVPEVRSHPSRPDAPQLLYRLLVSTRTGWWTATPTGPSLKAAAHLLVTRYRSTKWFAHLQKFESYHLNSLGIQP